MSDILYNERKKSRITTSRTRTRLSVRPLHIPLHFFHYPHLRIDFRVSICPCFCIALVPLLLLNTPKAHSPSHRETPASCAYGQVLDITSQISPVDTQNIRKGHVLTNVQATARLNAKITPSS
jgi:hypothetical protein